MVLKGQSEGAEDMRQEKDLNTENMIEKKIQQSIKFLQIACKGKDVELAYSGGKDSDVILELARMAGVDVRPIYKNTTIDPPFTIKHCKSKGVEILPPKKTFAKIIQENGFPTRWSRFCCKFLKEYKIGDKVITGVRRSESRKRAERYKEPTQCRVYPKGERVEIFMPILEWTDEDVEQFIKMRGIKCHPLYYDEEGNFHVERRLGCMGCPLMSHHKRIEDFKQHPNLVKFYIKNGQKYLDAHPNVNSAKRCRNAYEMFYLDVITHGYKEFYKIMQPNLWGERFDAKNFLEEYFKIEL